MSLAYSAIPDTMLKEYRMRVNCLGMKEFRCIIFNEHEAITALVDRRRQQKVPLPYGTISGLTFSPQDGSFANLNIQDDYGTKIPVTISEADMAASLVKYCLERKIPMPMSAKKSIEVIKGEVTLLMTTAEYDMTKPLQPKTKTGQHHAHVASH